MKKVSKLKLFELVLEQLERQHQTLILSAQAAKNEATNEESVAENKYDTRGLEASYLAGAQAKRAVELEEVIKIISDLKKNVSQKPVMIQSTSLVQVEIDEEEKQVFFILPKVGGVKLNSENINITVISPQSPLGELLMGLKKGDFFEFHIKNGVKEYVISDFY
ncbi:MAG: hypothetical protein HOO06_00120 [Bdellovibrionaceae bacterium]|jgi:transcription elongation GreA/GreB family factor|nr:hypothetical protein [Pseudobdellovibrionaceae bacterium]